MRGMCHLTQHRDGMTGQMKVQLKRREMAMLNLVMDVLLVRVKVDGMVGGMAADGMIQWKLPETAMQHTIMVVLLVHLKVDGMVGGMVVDGMVQRNLFVILHSLGKVDGTVVLTDGRM